ncbi:MAG: AAA family ATPase [Methylobacter sp.]|nr:AAA family ATPase [Methylobacter sp.]
MKIDFENLGGIDEGSVELNDFTLFCGKNNSGKTYVMYSLYGLLDNQLNFSFDFVNPIIDKLKQEGSYILDIAEIISEHQGEMVRHIEVLFKDYLPNLFGVTASEFSNTKIKLDFSQDEIEKKIKHSESFSYSRKDLFNSWKLTLNVDSGKIKLTLDKADRLEDSILQFFISERLVEIMFFDCGFENNSFLLPAERAGINLFFKELFSIRNLLLQEAQNDNVDPMRLLKGVLDSRYAEPVKDYMQFLNRIGNSQIEGSYSKYAQALEKNVLGGKYKVDEFGNVFFLPADSKNKLPLHFSSSTVKTLFGLVFYLEHLAKAGDYLMIDEPELNLHPDNQRQVARVLAQLVNAGLKVIVSTHSDYFVRELNNLIMLKKGFPGAADLQKKYGYQDNELLASKQVSAYLFNDKKITPMVLDDEEGVIAETFDAVINDLNKSSNEIYYALQDTKDGN